VTAIGSIRSPSLGQADAGFRQQAAHFGAATAPGRAPACVGPTAPSPLSTASLSRRPSAAFLAHLIAMRERAPQTRERRRAEPEEAAAVYNAANMRKPVAGQKMSLSN
jgi:hypothetical protein